METHQGLVHAADLLDVEGAIGQALVVEVEQLLEHAVDRLVVDAGHLHAGAGHGVDGGAAGRGPAFQEGVAGGVEQVAAAGGQDQGTVLRALEHDAEQGQ